MKKLLIILLYLPIIGFGQTHFIDQHNLQMYGNNSDPDISINTFYNTFDTCSISWNIITDSMPSQWEFSICFPSCFIIGTSSGQDLLLPDEQVFLNCHMYPNGQVGNGVIQMEITTNNLYKDTITWNGSISNVSFISEQNINNEILKVTDLLGRETKQKNQPLLYLYNDGTVKKKIIIE
ncbi:MAG: hypothetical protein CMD16_03940 [Flavobacteriales bacterium]|nr:hypothetical protein [Flavobacteriales bacterium]|tara:strand:+ start:12736 stop:13272 length:537 start_codon:yes stop_codon:yes gene_type:complete